MSLLSQCQPYATGPGRPGWEQLRLLGLSWTASPEDVARAGELESAVNAVASFGGAKSWRRRKSFRSYEDPDGRQKAEIDRQVEDYRQRCDSVKRLIESMTLKDLEMALAVIEFGRNRRVWPRSMWSGPDRSSNLPAIQIESGCSAGGKSIVARRPGGCHFDYVLQLSVDVVEGQPLKVAAMTV